MALLAAVAAVVQVLFILESHRHEVFLLPVVDAATYHKQALAILAGETAPEAFWQPPLYPAVLAGVYRMASPAMLGARLLHGLLAPAAALLTFLVARRLTTRGAAFVAALLTCFYGPLVFFWSQFLPAGLAVVLNLAALLLLLRFVERPTMARGVACGIAIGAAALAVGNALACLAVPAAWLARRAWRARAWRREAAWLGGLLLGVGLCLAPVTVRNRVVSGEWVPISTNAGVNLAIGNNPRMDETIALRPGLDWDRYVERPFARGARAAAEAQRDFIAETVRFARAQPGCFAANIGRKALRLINGYEWPRNISLYTFRDHSLVLQPLVWRMGALAFPFGLVCAAGLFGMRFGARANLGRGLVLAYILVYAATIVLFFPTARYRLPLVPPLLIFGVVGAVELRRRWRAGGVPRRAACAWAAALLILTHLPLASPTAAVNFEAELHKNLGVGFQVRGRGAEAVAQYGRALAIDPQYADAHYYLGTARRAAGELDAAEASFRAAVRLRQDHERAMHDLATLLHARGETEAAIQWLRRALDVNPRYGLAMHNLTIALQQSGRVEEAALWQRRARKLGLR